MRLPATVPTWSRAWHGSDLGRELESWDPVRWQPTVLAHRCWLWITATRRRRWIFWGLVAFFVLVVMPVALGAVAGAQTDTDTARSGGNSVLGATDMRDSYGVPVWQYTYVTRDESIWHPMTTVWGAVLGFMCALFLLVVVLPIWAFDSAIDLSWLDWIRAPLSGAAGSLTAQIATTAMFFFFVTLGSLIVAYFVARGFFAKASFQVATLLILASLSALFLRDPLEEVFSPHGMMAQGRDVGLSVAAGLNGDNHANPSAVAETMQENMVDNFVRHPLQVWNFGHIVDQRPGCANAWSSGILAGSDSQVKKGLKACNDSAAASAADNPGMGQVGAGLVLLFLMLFGIMPFFGYMAIKIVWSGLDSIYWGFMGLFGFAAGGYVYGPTQTFTIRSVVHGFFSFFRMAAEIIFVSVVALIENEMLKQAKGRETAVLFITAVVMIVAFLQAKRFTANLDRGNEWIANRFALAVQNGGSRAGGGSGGGGTALGMGQFGAGHKMSGMGMLALMGGASTIANSPLTEWMMMGLPGSFHPQSRMKKAMAKAQGGVWVDEGRFGGARGWYAMSYMNREFFSRTAAEEAEAYGGLDTYFGNAGAAYGVIRRNGGSSGDAFGAMLGAGAQDERMARISANSVETIRNAAAATPLRDADLSFVAAAVHQVENSSRLVVSGTGTPAQRQRYVEETAAHIGTLEQAVREYRAFRSGGVALDGGATSGYRPQLHYVQEYMNLISTDPHRAGRMMQALEEVAVGTPYNRNPTNPLVNERMALRLANVDADTAVRMKQWIVNENALNLETAFDNLRGDVTNVQSHRNMRDAAHTATRVRYQMEGGTGALPVMVTPSGGNPANPNWGPGMAPVNRAIGN
ncbi:hypothetical protein ACQP0C_12765 [Nocardia sp. CA-129566]|uniref:hypothetical protein n=1 Tax=Nocardia sp. CA-129566 TaxID=3239976 RepID=UPI003D981701